MFEQVFANLQQATQASIQMQQDLLRQWMGAWGEAPARGAIGTDAFASARKRWESMLVDASKRRRELLDAQYAAGIKLLEDAFAAGESQSPQELQAKVTELYRRSFESLKQLQEAQLRDLKLCWEQFAEMGVPAAL